MRQPVVALLLATCAAQITINRVPIGNGQRRPQGNSLVLEVQGVGNLIKAMHQPGPVLYLLVTYWWPTGGLLVTYCELLWKRMWPAGDLLRTILELL